MSDLRTHETTGPAADPVTAAYDAFQATCPTRQLLDALSNKWVCLVLVALREGALRHSDLRRRLVGVSQKMLTQTLRGLERDGLVEREVTHTVPPRVDYSISPLGRSLVGVVEAVKLWAEANMDDVTSARRTFDLQAEHRAGRSVRS